MPHDLWLGYFRQRGRLLATHLHWQCGQNVTHFAPYACFYFRYHEPALSGAAQFKNNGLIPARLVKAAQAWFAIDKSLLPDVFAH